MTGIVVLRESDGMFPTLYYVSDGTRHGATESRDRATRITEDRFDHLSSKGLWSAYSKPYFEYDTPDGNSIDNSRED